MISIQENSFKDNENFFPVFKNNRPITKHAAIIQMRSFNDSLLEAPDIFVSQTFYPEGRVSLNQQSQNLRALYSKHNICVLKHIKTNIRPTKYKSRMHQT